MSRHRLFFLVLAFVSPVLLHAADPGTVEGKLAIDGATIKLTHVYAIAVPTVDGNETLYKIIFSDIALTDKDLALFPDGQMKLINDGKMHALRLGLDNAKAYGEVEVFYANNTASITKPPSTFVLKPSDAETIAGRLYLDKPYKWIVGTFMYDLTFSAPLTPRDTLD